MSTQIDHQALDETIRSYRLAPIESPKQAEHVLIVVIGCAQDVYSDWEFLPVAKCLKLLQEDKDLVQVLEDAHSRGEYETLCNFSRLHAHLKPKNLQEAGHYEPMLNQAFMAPFVGDAAIELFQHMRELDELIQSQKYWNIYAKSLSIVQSSGTGKSRTLTEIGKLCYTLPICLRNGSGYPPPDKAVCDYLSNIPASSVTNHLSLTLHNSIARFLGAAHEIMLKVLKEKHSEGLDGQGLREWWHKSMELQKDRTFRDHFFGQAIRLANSKVIASHPNNKDEAVNAKSIAEYYYESYMKQAIDNLLNFLDGVHLGEPQFLVTYFDEAHMLDIKFWALQRLASCQDLKSRSWLMFLGTKSNISFYSPPVGEHNSARLKEELQHLLPPYIALNFDHFVYDAPDSIAEATIGELQSLEHLSKYGRPLWRAFPTRQLLDFASLKLTGMMAFDSSFIHHVFPILSHRICIETSASSKEALALTDRSVADHMRLLTGIVRNGPSFHTYSPSEPVLTLAAASLLYHNNGHHWKSILDVFAKDMCSSGLVDKGLLGEIASRLLLLIGRDFSAPVDSHTGARDLLKPTRLIDFLAKLFGDTDWAGENQADFDTAFQDAYVNFTHWTVTQAHLPSEPDPQLLPNLWARGMALQCSFNQESMDGVIPVYFGSVSPAAKFDASKVSPFILQFKFTNKANLPAEQSLRPMGVYRDPDQVLPYLAMLMDLGNESRHRENKSFVKATSWIHDPKANFPSLCKNLTMAIQSHKDCQKQSGRKSKESLKKQKEVDEKQKMVDDYKRYSISTRIPSFRDGILREACIVSEFSRILGFGMVSDVLSSGSPGLIERMWPTLHLSPGWMCNFPFTQSADTSLMDVDS